LGRGRSPRTWKGENYDLFGKDHHLLEFKENGNMRKWISIPDVSGNQKEDIDQNFCGRILAGQILDRWLLESEILRCLPHDLLNTGQDLHLQ
jgi:hypothetical protein